MTTRTWLGSSAAWGTPSGWSGDTAPGPGDTAIISAGTVTLAGAAEPQVGAYDDVAITLGSVLVLEDALLGTFESLDITAASTIESIGASGFEGTLDLTGTGVTLTLQASLSAGAVAGDLVLLNGAVDTLDDGGTLVQQGRLDVHDSLDIGSGGALVADGTIRLSDGLIEVESGGTISGPGTVHIGRYSSFYLEAGSAATSIAVTFDDAGGRLLVGTPANYTGQISNFMVGDIIDLLNGGTADYAYFDATAGLLTVRDDGSTGAVVASLHVQSSLQSGTVQSGPLAVTSDGGSGVDIAAPSALARTKYTIAGPDIAQGSDVVRASMTTSGGVAITGAGVKIGIISTSFDAHPGVGAADPANADAIAGYLPVEADGVTSAVTVLQDDPGSSDDEGRAMAELIHQVAPGAQLYFTTGDSFAEFVSGVAALQAQGCTIIVDDLSYIDEPMFQDAGPLDSAIDTAVAGGVSYFTSAGNFADASFQASGLTSANFSDVTLYGGVTAQSYIFDNGTPYQTITNEAGSGSTMTLSLQWDAPVPALNTLAPQVLVVRVYTMSGALVATSTAASEPTASGTQYMPGVELSLAGTAGTQYQVAISLVGGAPAPDVFKYILVAEGDGTGPGGVIDDAAAQQGAGTSIGHEMLTDVNSVGAMSYANTPVFGAAAGFTEYYSSIGSGEFLYSASGSKLQTPEQGGAVSLLAPVGAATAVSGFAPFEGTSAAAPDAAAVAALMLQANPNLTPAKVTSILDTTAVSLGLPSAEQGAGLVDATAAVAAAAAACYAAGTRLLTTAGERAIETLRVGELLVTLNGKSTGRVRWLGWRRQVDAAAIRIGAGALGEGMPHADLVVSPDHALWRDGGLVPAKFLAGRDGIAREVHAEVIWWHVELERHSVVLAEGAAAETYLDTGNRGAFANGAARPVWPGFDALVRERLGCGELRLA